jgi:hypothetical protein
LNSFAIKQTSERSELLSLNDSKIVITKTDRLCNKVAHGLCQLSRSVWCEEVLQGAMPTCVLKAALDDCNQHSVS